MKKEEFERKDGTKGFSYKAEDGDKVTAEADTIFVRETLAIVKEKPVKIINYGLQVATSEGESIFLSLTDGQHKVIKKDEPLTDKKIVFEKYEHKEYGTQLGARVVKE